ncbi:MAG: MarC family protein [Propionibacteriaceae bacterium]|nr:MarC family protein [Propionibacteriaceae bacterium]
MLDAYLFTSTLVTLFVILDPPGLLPVFLGLTRTMTQRERNRAALGASMVALGVIGVFAIFGRFILDYLHITIEALQISGGLLLLLVALQLLMGTGELDVSVVGTNIAIVPLGIPLLAGPGSIVAMMLAVDQAGGDLLRLATVGLALLTATGLVWVFLRFAGAIRRVLRESGTVLLTRIAGMLLAAIAVQMLADGMLAFLRQV